MTENQQHRRLSAILIADIAGYTSRVEKDTDGTVAAWKEARAGIINPMIEKHDGRIVKLTGDGFLVEFRSIIDAVECGIAMQEQLVSSILDFRMGINLGDIIDDGQDIHGEGVNIAARIEALAPAGGICISGGAYDQVRHRISHPFDDLGEHQVKHVSAPVRVFRVRELGEATGLPVKMQHNMTVLATVCLGASIIAGSLWWWQSRVDPLLSGADVTFSEKRTGPSIAVMPFMNLSDDKTQSYFADGISEDITTDLSKVTGLYVTSRSATLRFRASNSDPKEIGKSLGVNHILEGSVRRSGNMIRITAKLIETKSGKQLWAERFDRDANGLFTIQDEISARVVDQFAHTLDQAALKKLSPRTYTPNVDAYDLYIHGRAKRIPPTPANMAAALEMFQKAIQIDPQFAGGYAGAAVVYVLLYDITPAPREQALVKLEKATQLAEQAVDLDPEFGPGWGSLAEAYIRKAQFEKAFSAIQMAIQKAPNDSLMRASYGKFLSYAGRPAEGIEEIKQAMRMSPDSLPLLYFLAANYRVAGNFDEAIETLIEHRKRLGGRVLPAPTSQLIAAYVQAGQLDRARAEVKSLLKVAPHFNIEIASRNHVYKKQKDVKNYLDALADAGMPDHQK